MRQSVATIQVKRLAFLQPGATTCIQQRELWVGDADDAVDSREVCGEQRPCAQRGCRAWPRHARRGQLPRHRDNQREPGCVAMLRCAASTVHLIAALALGVLPTIVRAAEPTAGLSEPTPPPSEDLAGGIATSLRDLESKKSALEALLAGRNTDQPVPEAIGAPVNSPADVAGFLETLLRELPQLTRVRDAVAQDLGQVEARLPLPEAPPKPPDLIELPSAPAKPAIKKPGRPTRAERRLLAEYRQAESAYSREKHRHDQTLAKYDEELRAHADAVGEVERKRSAQRQKLESRLEIANLRLRILELQTSYLTALRAMMARLSGPALRVFADLGAPRDAGRARARELREVHAATARLLSRIRYLESSARAGRLVGFAVDQDATVRSLTQTIALYETQHASLGKLVDALEQHVDTMESKTANLREQLLSSAPLEGRQAIWDDLFRQSLDLQRRQRHTVTALTAATLDARELAKTIDSALPRPSQVGTTADARRILDSLYGLQSRLARATVGLESLSRRWDYALQRELVTLLTDLAAQKTRNAAFRLSAELLGDLLVEVMTFGEGTRTWLQEKRAVLGSIFEPAQGHRPWRDISHILIAFAIVALVFFNRRRATRLVSWTVSRAAKHRALRGRVGVLVRWATLAHAIAPTAAVLAAAYVGFAIVGYQHREIVVLEIVFGWAGLYVLGGTALHGLTRPVTRGRPALVGLQQATSDLLQVTYSRFFLFLVIAVIVDKLTRLWLGPGRLQTLIGVAMLVWLLGWAVWAMAAWRPTMARVWTEIATERPREARLATWMQRHWFGLVLSPVALLRALALHVYQLARDILRKGGVLVYLRTLALRRLSKKSEDAPVAPQDTELPAQYTEEFPLYPVLGEDGPVVLPREEQLRSALGQLDAWRETHADGSLVVLGGKGMGKTTFLGMLTRRVTDLPVVKHTWSRKTLSEEDVIRELQTSLKGDASDAEGVCAELCAGPERVILLDEGHNVFLRTIDGYRGFDTLVHIVNATSDKVFWVIVFNEFSWQFINESRRRARYFRRLLQLPRWTASDLQDLISRRNQRSGFGVEFDAALMDQEDAGERGFRLIEGGESYFRWLYEISGGNPRIATYYWLRSLKLAGARRLRVSLFREPELSDSGLNDDMVFVVASVCQHENLTVEDLQTTLRMRPDAALFAMQYLRERGIVEPKDNAPKRMTLSPQFYRSTLRLLRKKHLLLETA